MTVSNAEDYGRKCATIAQEIPRMSDEVTEMRMQLAVYADAITAFATAQSVRFVLFMARGDCSTRNVLSGLWYAVCIGGVVNVAYLILVFLSHQGADKIPKDSGAIAGWACTSHLITFLPA
jgi:hypothetical protein